MEDKEDDKKQGSCEQKWSHKFVNDTWPRDDDLTEKSAGILPLYFVGYIAFTVNSLNDHNLDKSLSLNFKLE